MLLTLATQIFLRLDLPELNLFLVINLGLNFTTNMVLTITSRDSVTKSWLKVDQNHKIEGPYIFYMLSLKKMLQPTRRRSLPHQTSSGNRKNPSNAELTEICREI